MKENVGRIDRGIRFALVPALAGFGYAKLGGRKGRLPGLAAIVAATGILHSAITRVCPVNHLLHIDTRTKRERARDEQAVACIPVNPFVVPDEEIASITTVLVG